MIQEGKERRVKKILKKLRYTVSILLVVIMIINAVPADIFEYVMDVYAEETAPTSGTCGKNGGDNLTWELSDNGTLTISGTGEMENYTSSFYAPWKDNGTSIKKVVISNGVTIIGNYAFYECSSVTEITISDSVTTIGDYAFYDC